MKIEITDEGIRDAIRHCETDGVTLNQDWLLGALRCLRCCRAERRHLESLLEREKGEVGIATRIVARKSQVIEDQRERIAHLEKQRDDLQAANTAEVERRRKAEDGLRLTQLRLEKVRGHECIEPGCSEIAQPYCPRHRGDWMEARP